MKSSDVDTAPVEQAMILAAGFGKRLRPFTDEVPKPLIEVLGVPLIEHALAHARRAGIRRVAINTHHLHPAIEEALGARYDDVELVFSHEPTILGTGGGIRQMAERLDSAGPFLVLNADALIDLDVEGLLAAHRARPAAATLVLTDAPDKERYGLIGTDVDERITTFAGRVSPRGPVVRERMFCGVHIITRAVLERLPKGEFSGVAVAAYPPMLDDGEVLRAFDHTGLFCDVGTPERLLMANLDLLTGRTRLSRAPRWAKCGGAVFVHPDAQVDVSAILRPGVVIQAGATVGPGAQVGPRVVVGRGARVGAGATLERAVLLGGARVSDGAVFRSGVLSPVHRFTTPGGEGAAT